MGILVDKNSRIAIAGITGQEAMTVAKNMLNYGTAVLAGISPGRKGETVHGIPVYDTIRQAVDEHGINTIVLYVPPSFVLDAVLETLANGIKLMVIPTENVPVKDMLKILYEAKASEARIIGPNTVGIINPLQRIKLGAIGGDKEERCFVPGCVGVISRSAGMTAETSYMVKKAGLGVSTAVSIGGDALIGTTPKEILTLFEEDLQTKAVVTFSEQGTLFEEEVAEFIKQGGFTKPLIAAIAGRFTEQMPEGTLFGHSGAIICGGFGKPSTKIEILKEAGVYVADKYDDIITILQDLNLANN